MLHRGWKLNKCTLTDPKALLIATVRVSAGADIATASDLNSQHSEAASSSGSPPTAESPADSPETKDEQPKSPLESNVIQTSPLTAAEESTAADTPTSADRDAKHDQRREQAPADEHSLPIAQSLVDEIAKSEHDSERSLMHRYNNGAVRRPHNCAWLL
jgi:hypothetical protein